MGHSYHDIAFTPTILDLQSERGSRANYAAMGAVVAINAAGKGNISESGELWKIEELMMGKAAPLVIGDNLFCFDDRGKLHVLDRQTGDPVGRPISLGGTALRSSPLYADGKIYAVTRNNGTFVLAAKPKFEQLAHNRFSEDRSLFNASPAISGGNIFIRSNEYLYCLGK